MKDKQLSPALQFVAHAWEAIPRRAWSRLNHGMFSALRTAIESGMEFVPDDLIYMRDNFRLHRWLTEGGEGLYSLACGSERGSENVSAAIAFEKWFPRPAYLWAEKTKTPERLAVRSQFTWEGQLVTVTSFGYGKLTACTYKDTGSAEAIDRRFSVTHAALTAVRKAYDARKRAYLKEIAAAETAESLAAITVRCSAEPRGTFRHFDIEEIRAAYLASPLHKSGAVETAALQRWMDGENVYAHFDSVRLRIKGDQVETSTQQSASLANVLKVLPFLRSVRKKGWKSNGETREIDRHPLHSVSAKGVQVGCTLVPWSEIDRVFKS